MENEKQKEMERCIRGYIDNINAENSDTMCGLVKPRFVSCDAREQTLMMSYPAQYWEQNPIGRMQGGVVAALLDCTGGYLVLYYGGKMSVTVSLQISYLRPGPTDGNMMVKARLTKSGRTLLHAFAECWSENEPGKLVATANMVYMAQG